MLNIEQCKNMDFYQGIDSPYEEPKNPNLKINTENETVDESVEKIFSVILEKIKV